MDPFLLLLKINSTPRREFFVRIRAGGEDSPASGERGAGIHQALNCDAHPGAGFGFHPQIFTQDDNK
jgi:hypothetical protein